MRGLPAKYFAIIPNAVIKERKMKDSLQLIFINPDNRGRTDE